MSESHRQPLWPLQRLVVLLATSIVVAGCFELPPDNAVPRPAPANELARKVQKALHERPEDALAYAGLYSVLADRFEAGAYSTTSEAAAVAGRAAEILRIPGLLKSIVNDKLNPLLGKPQPLTPELREQASKSLRELAAACKEAAR
jgi:hypothetical protein